jgi:hypothetical protein
VVARSTAKWARCTVAAICLGTESLAKPRRARTIRRKELDRIFVVKRLKDQVQIAELVPEIAVLNRFVVSGADFFRRQERAQQIEMARFRFV